MKKTICVLFAAIMILSLSACGTGSEKGSTSAEAENTAQTSESEEKTDDTNNAAAEVPEASGVKKEKLSLKDSIKAKGEYKKAIEAMESKDYAAAAEIFSALGDYNDSAEKLLECDYMGAVELYNKGNFEAAKSVFDAMGDYQDSRLLSENCADGIFRAYLIGKWTSQELNISDTYNDAVRELFPAELMENFLFNDFNIVINLKFTDSSTFVLSMDTDRFSATADSLLAAIKESVIAYADGVYQKLADEHKLSMAELYAAFSVKNTEELFAVDMGMTVDEYIESITTKDYIMSLAKDVSENGTYEVKGGNITLHVGTDSIETAYNENKKTISLYSSDMGEMLTFKKAK